MIGRLWRGGILAAAVVALQAPVAEAAEPQSFDAGSWTAIRRHYKGRPVAVHLWGLTCGPCRVELPQWGRFHAQHPELAIVLIHAEPPPPTSKPIEELLARAGLGDAESWNFADAFQEPLRFAIAPAWRGELPMTLLIGRNGAIETIKGSADLGHVAEWYGAEQKGQAK